MVIRVGLLVVTRLVVDFPFARNGCIALACWGIVPAAVAAIVTVVHVISTFLNVVTRFARRFCVFWIARALDVGMLAVWSMQVTGLKVLVLLRRRCLAVTARILSGTNSMVPYKIIRARRNSL